MKNLIVLEALLPDWKRKRENLLAQIDKVSSDKHKATASDASKLLQEQSVLEKQLSKDILALEKERDTYVAQCEKTKLSYRDHKNRHWREIPQMYTDSYKPTAKPLDTQEAKKLAQKAEKGGMFAGGAHKKLYYMYADAMAYTDNLIQYNRVSTDRKISKLREAHEKNIAQLKQKYSAAGTQINSTYSTNYKHYVSQLNQHDNMVENQFMTRYRVLESILRTSPSINVKDWKSYTAPAKMPTELYLGRVSVTCPCPPQYSRQGRLPPGK